MLRKTGTVQIPLGQHDLDRADHVYVYAGIKDLSASKDLDPDYLQVSLVKV